MKGLSSLDSSRSKYSTGGLNTIRSKIQNIPQYNSMMFRTVNQMEQTRQALKCAYHAGQKITNFCKNQNCLLPLCPKCIKIHSQQHQRMGVYGSYETIGECLQECQQLQKSTIHRLQQMVRISQQMSVIHKQQITISHSQLSKAKQQLIDYIESVFKFYQQQVNKLIIQTSKDYQKEIVQFHKQVITLLSTQKQLGTKLQSNSTKLQALIDFYSKTNINMLLNNYTEKIQEIKPKYVQLTVNTYEMERVKVILKKYLDFREFNSRIQHNLEESIAYKRVTLTSNHSSFDNNNSKLLSHSGSYSNSHLHSHKQSQKQFIRSPIKNLFKTSSKTDQGLYNESSQKYGFPQKGQIARMIQQKLSRQSKLDTFESPLQVYSLQRSRQRLGI